MAKIRMVMFIHSFLASTILPPLLQHSKISSFCLILLTTTQSPTEGQPIILFHFCVLPKVFQQSHVQMFLLSTDYANKLNTKGVRKNLSHARRNITVYLICRQILFRISVIMGHAYVSLSTIYIPLGDLMQTRYFANQLLK